MIDVPDDGKAEVESEWQDRLGDLASAWRCGTADDLLAALRSLAVELEWTEDSEAHDDLFTLLDDDDAS